MTDRREGSSVFREVPLEEKAEDRGVSCHYNSQPGVSEDRNENQKGLTTPGHFTTKCKFKPTEAGTVFIFVLLWLSSASHTNEKLFSSLYMLHMFKGKNNY